MPKIINVPQGFCATITNSTLNYGINGLYTYGFSVCNIVLAYNSNQIFLMHADPQNAHKLSEELNNFSENFEVYIIYRENDEMSIRNRNYIKQIIHKSSSLKHHSIQEKSVSDNVKSICICLDKHGQTTVDYKIRGMDSLLFHPHEQQIETLTKMEQLLDLPNRKQGILNTKKCNIFKGTSWSSIPDSELKTKQDDNTKQLIENFNNQDNMTSLITKIRSIFNSKGIKCTTQDYYEFATKAELYLNDFDFATVFKREILDLCTYLKPQTSRDKKFIAEIKKLASISRDTYKDITAKFNEYKEQNASNTDFKETC